MSQRIASTPNPPYFAVVLTSLQKPNDVSGYEAMAARMMELAAIQPGYLGVESVRNEDGLGITVSYWRDLESIRRWKDVGEHQEAQRLGRQKWYQAFRLRVCRVEQEYGLQSDGTGSGVF